MASVVVREIDEHVVELVLDDPARRNALSASLVTDLEAAADAVAARDDWRCVVLSGAGGCFCSGGDLDSLRAHSAEGRERGPQPGDGMLGFYQALLCLTRLPQPVIASVAGSAVGAGACLVLASDLAVAAEDARIGFTFTRLGLHPGLASSWLLPRRVGSARAAELLITGRLVSGPEAMAMGLVNRAVPAAELDRATRELARSVASAAPLAVRQLKASLRGTWDVSAERQLAAEVEYQMRDFATADVAEGLAAIRDGRRPTFAGR